ncbi:transcriptional regulator, GntR family [Paracoccus thiocyanatus]|uniref:Transcriptional regulator, GntR family n=1 Tax=Paracoccus thiocyanatus TaxID=34006 RepID=A0A1N6QEU8_9RHOB|nr:GntR family transcriptional regulator [Paracoccus thiocyanatus]SIQ14916.1 transcriptional regulator, GntR family [Paracoccus thiocyanatus]
MDRASTQTHSATRAQAPFAAQLHARLRQRIVQGELPPGARLSEQEIADGYAMSRQPVREAFIRLAGEGLLEVRPQRGTFVTRIDLEWVLCTRFIRESVEADIVRLAASQARRQDHQTLFEQIAAQETQADPTTLVQLDEEFHATLARIAGKALVWSHLQQVKMPLDRARHLLSAITPKDIMLAQHRSVAEAIAAGDPDAAEAAMRLHLRRVLLDLPGVLRLSPDYFTSTDSFAATLAAQA